MSFASTALDLAREIRWWGSSTTCTGCPWGAIVLGALVLFLCGLCIGVSCAAACLSVHCRQGLVVLLRLLVGFLGGQGGPAVVGLEARLAQYRRDH